jgi:hypothetical protein
MTTVDRAVIIRFAAIAVAALIAGGCNSKSSGTGGTGPSGSLPVLTVNFSGSGHWEEAHPQLAPAPTRTVNASVTWQILYKVDFANRTVTLISRDITGTGGAAHSSSGDIVCSGPIVADPTQTNGPTLDLVDAWPTGPTGSATFQTQAMGGSAFHVCDPAWATGIHGFPGYDKFRGDAPITISLADWTSAPAPKTTNLPAVDAHEVAQEIPGGAPATLDVHWAGYFTVSKN